MTPLPGCRPMAGRGSNGGFGSGQKKPWGKVHSGIRELQAARSRRTMAITYSFTAIGQRPITGWLFRSESFIPRCARSMFILSGTEYRAPFECVGNRRSAMAGHRGGIQPRCSPRAAVGWPGFSVYSTTYQSMAWWTVRRGSHLHPFEKTANPFGTATEEMGR